MIERVISIMNVGKFVNCKAAGDVTFRKLTLIYGENGRGKTTLCDILRSLSNGDSDRIAGRKTLGSDEPPLTEILITGGKRKFSNGSWCQPFPHLTIYDSAFVHENVYAGDVVDHEHKKNLYRVIVGEEGVRLARFVDELDASIRELNKQLKTAKVAVERSVPKGMRIEAFIALEEDVEVEKKIKEAETTVEALSEADALKRRSGLTFLTLPTLPEGLESLLKETLDDVSPDAEQVVRDHLNSHMTNGQEQWLSSGHSMLKGDDCPFCGQSIDGVALISSYRSLFSNAYETLKGRLRAVQQTTNQSFGASLVPSLQKSLAENQASSEYWTRFVTLPDQPSLNIDGEIKAAIEEVRLVAERYLARKLAAPLEPFPVQQDFDSAIKRFDDAGRTVSEYNAFVTGSNAVIDQKKRQVDSGDLKNAQANVVNLKARKARQEQNVKDVCDEYKRLLAEKDALERCKNAAKVELDKYSDNVFGQYESRINQLLTMFNAGFRITGTRRRYVGGTPSSSFELLINEVPVDVGDGGTPLASACFKNTLSSGDRNTLALAFFLAQLERKADLGDAVVVFDDPFTSQDRSRRTCTQQQINRLVQSVKQVIVLSHETTFLRMVWEGDGSKEKKPLQLARLGQHTTITEWDIQEATKANYVQMHSILSQYRNLGSGDRRLVAQTIRPLLESYLRLKLPTEFGDREWLGDFIKKIREADPTNPADAAKTILEEIEAVNDFSKRYHHNTNSAADSEPIDDGELESYASRTLQIVGGF